MFEKFGRNIDQVLRDVGRETGATRIEAKTDTVTSPYPEAALPLLKLDLSVGTLALTPGNDQLVEGTVTYNIAEWTPQVKVEGSTVTVKQEVGMHLIGAWNDPHNDWKLALGTTRPFGLSISKGAGESWMALGGVPLTSTRMSIGAGKVQIGFDKLNPAACDDFTISMGAGSIVVDDLLNSNTSAFDFSGGAGEMTLNVTGQELQRPLVANLTTGAGRITLNVKRGIRCQIIVKKVLGNTRTQGDFRMVQAQTYENASFAEGAGPVVKIQINTPVADISINEVG